MFLIFGLRRWLKTQEIRAQKIPIKVGLKLNKRFIRIFSLDMCFFLEFEMTLIVSKPARKSDSAEA